MGELEPTPAARLRVVGGQTYADWESVYADNVIAVYRLIYRQVGNRPDAEDPAEEVFLAALPRLRLPAAVASVGPYLGAPARTGVADPRRRHPAPPPSTPFETAVAAPA